MEAQRVEVEERQTLMQAFELLDSKCRQMDDIVRLTERVNEKLNRTEDAVRVEGELTKKSEDHYTIVELFNNISRKLEAQINIAGSNLERTLNIIE